VKRLHEWPREEHASRAAASVRWSQVLVSFAGAVAEAGPGARHNAQFCVAG
jgi:hypothetical protein